MSDPKNHIPAVLKLRSGHDVDVVFANALGLRLFCEAAAKNRTYMAELPAIDGRTLWVRPSDVVMIESEARASAEN